MKLLSGTLMAMMFFALLVFVYVFVARAQRFGLSRHSSNTDLFVKRTQRSDASENGSGLAEDQVVDAGAHVVERKTAGQRPAERGDHIAGCVADTMPVADEMVAEKRYTVLIWNVAAIGTDDKKQPVLETAPLVGNLPIKSTCHGCAGIRSGRNQSGQQRNHQISEERHVY
jgi:hypothetical protein